MLAQPDVSVVIVNYNTRALLIDCVASVIQETHRARVQILVGDNASTDGSVEEMRHRFPNIQTVAFATNLGFPEGNNRLFSFAAGRYTLLLNPDTIVLDSAIDRMVEFMDRHSDVGVVGAKMFTVDRKPWRYETWYFTPGSYLLHPLLLRLRGDIGNADVDWVPGACLMIRSALAQQIGPLDRFMFGEDLDWCFRVRQAGWRVYHLAEAKIIHIWGAAASTPEKAAWRVFITRQSKLYYTLKHSGRTAYQFFAVAILTESMVKLLLTAVRWPFGSAVERGYWSGRMRGYRRLVKSIVKGSILIDRP
jgi:GT2 family glycosyltransferase